MLFQQLFIKKICNFEVREKRKSPFLGRMKKIFNSTHHQFSFISTKFTTPFEAGVILRRSAGAKPGRKSSRFWERHHHHHQHLLAGRGWKSREGLGKLTTMTSTTKAITTHKTKRVCKSVLAFVKKGKGILFSCSWDRFLCCPGVTRSINRYINGNLSGVKGVFLCGFRIHCHIK